MFFFLKKGVVLFSSVLVVVPVSCHFKCELCLKQSLAFSTG